LSEPTPAFAHRRDSARVGPPAGELLRPIAAAPDDFDGRVRQWERRENLRAELRRLEA
jgi:hypothetical protein